METIINVLAGLDILDRFLFELFNMHINRAPHSTSCLSKCLRRANRYLSMDQLKSQVLRMCKETYNH